MNRIQLMDENLSNLIAAGEVVVSPFNVVKELVENAVDAQASKITIELIDGGITKIRVVDNGIGMSFDDAKLCFVRHATSKVKDEFDLYHIQSLGFRGEALCSIAAVSNVLLQTSLQDQSGTLVHYQFSKLLEAKVVKVINGTDIEVTQLFHNTPARLKYLNTTGSEGYKSINYLQKMALLYPEIDFCVISDNREILNTTNLNDLASIMCEIYTSQIAEYLVYFSETSINYQIEGYFTTPNYTKGSQKHFHISINGRMVENEKISKSVLLSFDQRLMVQRFPVGIINVTVDPQLVDVNVHPNKTNVKLALESELYELISNTLKKAIDDYYYNLYKPSNTISFQQNLVKDEPKLPVYDFSTIFTNNSSIGETKDDSVVTENILKKETVYEQPDLCDEVIFEDFSVLGQFSGTYIMFVRNQEFFILDQHAAQERLNFQKFQSKISNGNFTFTTLLTPLVFTFTTTERQKIISKSSELSKLGVHFELLGAMSIEVFDVVEWLDVNQAQTYIQRLFDAVILDEKISLEKLLQEALIMLACKLSLKANQVLTRFEQEQLIKDLFECENFDHCPHGRPIFVKHTLYDLEKMFKRVT